ncbi:MAG TPA: hypothetical protein VER55_05770 [Ardenticatenaceae bacterium]|nr:hypothetical protein [Ardenticatenaceae bacterium]
MIVDTRLAAFEAWPAPDPSTDFPFWYRLAYSADEPILVVGDDKARVVGPLSEYGIQTLALTIAPRERVEAHPGTASPVSVPVPAVARDIRSSDFRQRFGLVLFPDNAVLRLLSGEDQLAALRNIQRHLRLGGRVALALFVPDLGELAAAAGARGGGVRFLAELEASDTLPRAVVYEHRQVLPFEQIVEQHLLIESLDSEGRGSERRHHHTRLAYLWPRQVQFLLQLAGFDIEEVYGGFRSEPLGPASAQQVWVARKMRD